MPYDLSQLSAAFVEKVTQEFKGSSLSWEWVELGVVSLLPSQEYHNGEIVGYPVYEALNWEIPRTQAFSRVKLGDAMAFVDRFGDIWKAKVQTPDFDKKADGTLKPRKYEHKKGGSKEAPGWYIPSVPDFARIAIAVRWEEEIPMEAEEPDFWRWFNTANHNIPLLITEGEKKTLCGLQHGYPTIGAMGITGGYRVVSRVPLVRELASGIRDFNLDRAIVIAYDSEDSPEGQQKCDRAASVLGRLLEQEGATVTTVHWDNSQGKGLDDIIAQSGIEAFDFAFLHRRSLKSVETSIPTDMYVEMGCLSKADADFLSRQSLLAIKAHKGTGKTKLLAEILRIQRQIIRNLKTINIVHRVTLGTQISVRIGTIMRNDHDSQILPDELSFCLESIHLVDPEKYQDCVFVIDECRQVLMHLLMSQTLKNYRNFTISRFRQMLQNSRQVILADADLTIDEIQFFEGLLEKKCFVLQNTYKHSGFDTYWYQGRNDSAIRQSLWEHLENTLDVDGRRSDGKVTVIASDSKDQTKTVELEAIKRFPALRVLVINQETTGEDIVRDFVRNPDADICNWDLIVYSPTLGTGVSIEAMGVVDSVWGLFSGYSLNTPSMSQALSRVRDLVPRHVWCADEQKHWKFSNSGSPKKIKEILFFQVRATITCLEDERELDELANDLHHRRFAESWFDSPFVNLYCKYIAADNRDGHDLRGNLRARLIDEGNRVINLDAETCQEAQEAKSEAKKEIIEREREQLKSAELISDELAKLWSKSQTLTKDQRVLLEKWRICDFYAVDKIDDELLDFHGEKGEGRKQVQEFRRFVDKSFAIDLSSGSLDRILEVRKPDSSDSGFEAKDKAVQDMNFAASVLKILHSIGLRELMNPDVLYKLSKVEEVAKKALFYRDNIKKLLGARISEKMQPLAIVQLFIKRMGLTFKTVSRTTSGRLYRFGRESLEWLLQIVDRQQRKATQIELAMLKREMQNHADPSHLYNKTGGVGKIEASIPDKIDWDDLEDLAQMIHEEILGVDALNGQCSPLAKYVLHRVAIKQLFAFAPNPEDVKEIPQKVKKEKVKKVKAVSTEAAKVEAVEPAIEVVKSEIKPKKKSIMDELQGQQKWGRLEDVVETLLDIQEIEGRKIGDAVMYPESRYDKSEIRELKEDGSYEFLRINQVGTLIGFVEQTGGSWGSRKIVSAKVRYPDGKTQTFAPAFLKICEQVVY